jgi:guanylate kinase
MQGSQKIDSKFIFSKKKKKMILTLKKKKEGKKENYQKILLKLNIEFKQNKKYEFIVKNLYLIELLTK